MRIAAIDLGKVKIGLAMTDLTGKVALPFATIEAEKSLKDSADKILKRLPLKEVSEIIIGLPLLLNGQKGKMALIVEEFAKIMQSKISIPIVLVDERFSSLEAERSLKEANLNRKKREDEIAALIILKSYVSSRN